MSSCTGVYDGLLNITNSVVHLLQCDTEFVLRDFVYTVAIKFNKTLKCSLHYVCTIDYAVATTPYNL